ncbi:unnamed protein product [Symbiodinium natans]|uniref:Uncharacterized protein n=1 Tax=Symbiodinium natans TaxID=878477 RepID=A0A812I6M0_9DINO|nr:unnamed protein product [Symbiodinium natans]
MNGAKGNSGRRVQCLNRITGPPSAVPMAKTAVEGRVFLAAVDQDRGASMQRCRSRMWDSYRGCGGASPDAQQELWQGPVWGEVVSITVRAALRKARIVGL